MHNESEFRFSKVILPGENNSTNKSKEVESNDNIIVYLQEIRKLKGDILILEDKKQILIDSNAEWKKEDEKKEKELSKLKKLVEKKENELSELKKEIKSKEELMKSNENKYKEEIEELKKTSGENDMFSENEIELDMGKGVVILALFGFSLFIVGLIAVILKIMN